MNWDRINIWTNTLYTLLHSLYIAKQIDFGNLGLVHESVVSAGKWVTPDCSFDSVLLSEDRLGRRRISMRRDPNVRFDEIAQQIVKMLLQDLVIILDEMCRESLEGHGLNVPNFPQSKVQRLNSMLPANHAWAGNGCLELIAVRNVLTHSNGKWNSKSISIVDGFIQNPPVPGEKLVIGTSMLFRYRKAMRTMLNETKP